jgi:photosystem II stability/assembly factor-like uncharacterized protein
MMKDENTAFISGCYSHFMGSFDGCRNWIDLPLTSQFGILELNSVCFNNKHSGFMVGGNASRGIIFHSEDSGRNWDTLSCTSTSEYNSIYFVSDSIGYIAGCNGKILKTPDGGRSWTLVRSLACQDLNAVYFLNTKCGYAVGDRQLILKTTDGGSSWSSLSRTGRESLWSICLSEKDKAIVVGTSGTILCIQSSE